MTEDALRSPGEGNQNKLKTEDMAVHDWYRFVLSFPPHLIRQYLQRFDANEGSLVLDPFCGTGTTLVECKKLGVASVGVEAHPMTHFASSVKLDWTPDPDGLMEHATAVAEATCTDLAADGVEDKPSYNADTLFGGHEISDAQDGEDLTLRTLPGESHKLLLTGSISPRPLHKTLVLLDHLNCARDGDEYVRHERLALAKVLPSVVGNLRFGPEVGVGPAKPDAAVVSPWLSLSIRRSLPRYSG